MAITLDIIESKQFTEAKNGYKREEVEDFLNEILEEMEIREEKTKMLEAKIATLTRDLEQARKAPAAAQAPATAAKAGEERRSSESYELVLAKAQHAYDEIVSAAEARADEILNEAKKAAANSRQNAESQISDLTENLAALRKQANGYYAALKKVVETQSVSLDQLKNLL